MLKGMPEPMCDYSYNTNQFKVEQNPEDKAFFDYLKA